MSGVPLQPISKLRVEGRVLRRSPLPRRIYRFRVRTKRDVPHDSPRNSFPTTKHRTTSHTPHWSVSTFAGDQHMLRRLTAATKPPLTHDRTLWIGQKGANPTRGATTAKDNRLRRINRSQHRNQMGLSQCRPSWRRLPRPRCTPSNRHVCVACRWLPERCSRSGNLHPEPFLSY